MKKQMIYEFICAFVDERTDGWITDIKHNDNLVDALGFDSIDLADLKIRLEKKFSIYIENGAVYEWKTVKDVVEDVYHLANY